MSTNYVIATYAATASTPRPSCDEPPPCDQLAAHVAQLNKLEHELSTVTIMRAEVGASATKIEGYYEKARQLYKENFKEISVRNYGYSNGQWLRAFELDEPKHDYYIFAEDDYVPLKNNFDAILKKLYRKVFPDDVGALCGIICCEKLAPGPGHPPHYDSTLMLSRKSLERIYSDPKWCGDPRAWLYRVPISKTVLEMTPDQLARSLASSRSDGRRGGGGLQLAMSCLMNLSGVKLKALQGLKHDGVTLMSPYWDPSRCYRVLYIPSLSTGMREGRKLTEWEQLNSALFAPVQASCPDWLAHNTSDAAH